MKIVFYSNLAKHDNWMEMFDKVGFYKDDIKILRNLGHDVKLAHSIRSIDLNADLYFCWWWGYSIFPLIIGLIRRVPVIVTGAFDYSSGFKKFPGLNYIERPLYQKLIMNFVLRFASSNIFISKSEHAEVVNNLYVNNPAVSYLCVDSDFYYPIQYHESRNTFFTVCWSDLTNARRKGLYNSYDAFKLVASVYPSVTFTIAGKIAEAAEQILAQAAVDGLADRVNFIGMVSDEVKLKYMQTCIAYLQPSIYEGFGLALAEALASGANVIVSNGGAIPEVAGEYGIYINPEDSKSIAQAMTYCIINTKSYGQAINQNKWVKDNFSLINRQCVIKQIIEESGK